MRTRIMKSWKAFALATLLAHGAAAQELRSTLFEAADEALEVARAANAALLAPRAFEDGLDAYTDAEASLERGRNIDRIRNQLAEAVASFQEAAEAAEIANSALLDKSSRHPKLHGMGTTLVLAIRSCRQRRSSPKMSSGSTRLAMGPTIGI